MVVRRRIPDKPLAQSRPSLAGRLLLWGLVFGVRASIRSRGSADRTSATRLRYYYRVSCFAIVLTNKGLLMFLPHSGFVQVAFEENEHGRERLDG